MTVLAHLPPVHRCQHADDADRCATLCFAPRTRCNQHSGEPVQRHVLEPREVRAMRRRRKPAKCGQDSKSQPAATAWGEARVPAEGESASGQSTRLRARAEIKPGLGNDRVESHAAAGRVIPAHLRTLLTLAVLIALGYLLAAVTSGERSGAW